MDLKNQKDFLRKKYLQLRQNFFNQFSFEQEKQLISNIFSLEEFKKAKVVLSYMSKDAEVPTRNLNLEILKSQKVLCLPKTDIKNKNLIIKKYNILPEKIKILKYPIEIDKFQPINFENRENKYLLFTG
ncbi:MAG: 5-formyltetrahydrofolate cyclo-ligase, partial [Candidatus Anstonellaceae archaeon]